MGMLYDDETLKKIKDALEDCNERLIKKCEQKSQYTISEWRDYISKALNIRLEPWPHIDEFGLDFSLPEKTDGGKIILSFAIGS